MKVPSPRCGLMQGRTVALAVAVVAAMPILVRAATSSNWKADNGESGGDFSSSAHWNGDIPGMDDTANFGLSDAYGVTFTQNPQTSTTNVTAGDVTFDLAGGGYTTGLLNVSSASETPSLTLQGGGTVATTNFSIGKAAGDNGSLIIDGQDANSTTLTYSAISYVGQGGTGSLTIQGGGIVSSSADLTVSSAAGSVGYLTVTGDGSTLDVDQITASTYGRATILVEKGGTVQSGKVIANGSGNSLGSSITITGPGSSWTSSSFSVTSKADGTVRIEDGGTLTTSTLFLTTNGGDGSVVVTGKNSTLKTRSFNIGNGESGSGTVTVEAGGMVIAHTPKDTHIINSNGTLNLHGDSNFDVSAFQSIGGTIDIAGQNNILDLAEGNGDHEFYLNFDSATTTVVHLFGDSDYSQLTINSDGAFDFGGTLDVMLEGSYMPIAGQSYQLFTYGDATPVGHFDLIASTLPNGLVWDDSELYTNGILKIAVPEPASIGLLLMGGGLLAMRRRRA